MKDDPIRAAWEAYHGPVDALDGYIPATPPTFERGYRDGWNAAMKRATDDLHAAMMELRYGAQSDDERYQVASDQIELCRDRLQALVTP